MLTSALLSYGSVMTIEVLEKINLMYHGVSRIYFRSLEYEVEKKYECFHFKTQKNRVTPISHRLYEKQNHENSALDRGVNHSVEISGNPYKKSEISYA